MARKRGGRVPVPLAITVVDHGAGDAGTYLLDYLIRRLYRDPDKPFSPAPAVPVAAGRISAAGALDSPFADAARAAVLVPLRDAAVVDTTFVGGVEALVSGSDTSSRRVYVVPLSPNALRLPSDLVRTSYLRVADAAGAAGRGRIASGLSHELCRWLQGRPRDASASLSDGETPITVFLSHAKSDGSGIAQEFVRYFQQETRLNSFFDAHDLTPGFQFDRELAKRIETSILLVIRTEAFGSREWCQREVLAAKQLGVPVVLVDALESSERRAFPYLGNVPAIRYHRTDPQRHEVVLDLLLDETLRQLHFRHRVKRLSQTTASRRPVVFASAPELVRFALNREAERRVAPDSKRRLRHVVYPDPPVSAAEALVLAHDAETIRAESLTQFVSRPGRQLADKIVALSTSEAENATDFGLTALHQRDLVVEVARHLFAVNARIGYGGDFRSAGFAELLAEVHRAHARFATGQLPRIRSYPISTVPADARAAYVDAVEFMDPAVAVPPSESEEQLRALQLRAMRAALVKDASALVVIGGRLAGFQGWRPGVAEEIATAVSRRRPVFLVGGFGGTARAYAEAAFARSAVPPSAPNATLGPEPQDNLALPSLSEVLAGVRGGIGNGLSKEQNLRLARSADTDEIVQLLLRGLSWAASKAAIG